MVLFVKLQELLFICVMIAGTVGFDYCTIESCAKGEHTMCKFPNEALAPACGTGGGNSKGFNGKLRDTILKRHNEHRLNVALNGQHPQPHASNMMKLTWNDEAEKIAQRWANQCIAQHDNCRNLEHFIVGQNMASSWGPGVAETEGKLKDFTDMWYDEVKDFDKGQIARFQFNMNTGHYTQVVWAETTSIGCGFVEYEQKPGQSTFNLFCNYVPAGNIMGEPVYKIGKPCSECPEGAGCSKTYPGLCTTKKSDFGGIPEEYVGKGAIAPEPSVFLLLVLLRCVLCTSSVM